jgi:diguanylate cyclase (GGDEF)-like protein
LPPRTWPLRLQARVGLGLVIALIALAIGQLWGMRAESQLREEASDKVLETARTMADRLSREMAARHADVKLLAKLDVVREASDPAAMRAALEKVRSALPAYAWLGVTDAAGAVIASTDDVLLGTSFANRPVFQKGRLGLWSGDVHDAVLLAPYFPRDGGEAVKLVDVAAPLHNADGSLRGVLALHMSWQWASQVRDAVLQPHAGRDSTQLLLFGADGKLLLGSKGGVDAMLPPDTLRRLEHRASVERWSDGIEAVSASAESRPSGDFAGFRWRVLARDAQAVVPAEVARVRREAWIWSSVVGAVCIAVAWWLIGVLFAPLERLAKALRGPRPAARRDGVRPQRRNDVQQIAAAVTKLQDTLKDREQTVRDLERQVHADPLTGLSNRAYLTALSQRLEQEPPTRPMEFCVLCLDLDNFKPINDAHGHAAGDALLVQVARRLRRCARSDDVVIRLGGDEFMLLLPCPAGEGAALARAVSQRIIAELARPLSYLTLTNLRVGCSVGAALWTPGQSALSTAMERADEALYLAKRGGRSQFRQHAATTIAAAL